MGDRRGFWAQAVLFLLPARPVRCATISAESHTRRNHRPDPLVIFRATIDRIERRDSANPSRVCVTDPASGLSDFVTERTGPVMAQKVTAPKLFEPAQTYAVDRNARSHADEQRPVAGLLPVWRLASAVE